MTGDSFCHLHNHSAYSLLDGAAKLEPMVKAAVADGQPGIALTDHGNLYGLMEFYRICRAYGINPILGLETYFAHDRHERGKRSTDTETINGTDKRYYHLTVLAENNVGYHNLLKLSSDSFLDGYYFKPRADWELLEKYSEGLIVTSGCLGGPVLQELLHDRFDNALAQAARLQDIFGRDNFLIELQDHGLPEQKKTNPQLIQIARSINAPMIVANDCHYVQHDDHVAHDALLCQPAGSLITKVAGTGFGLGITTKQIPIEDIQVGDKVVSWDSSSRHMVRRHGNIVTKVGNRRYLGKLITVRIGVKQSRYTHDHLVVCNLGRPLRTGNHVVYMMRQGDSYRIGSTEWIKSVKNRDCNKLGLAQRIDQQNADAVWVLGVFGSKHEAQEEEYFLSHAYGVPTWSFHNVKKGAPRTPYYESLWNRVGSLQSNAERCLSSLGLDISLPLWQRGRGPLLQRRAHVTAACNLIDGMALLDIDLVDTNNSTPMQGDCWVPCEVSSSSWEGEVYSLEVEQDHTYFADGILTHNCVQTQSRMADEKRFRFQSDQHYLKSAQEMRYLFSEVPEACNNTLWVSERANVTIDFDSMHLPVYDPPEGFQTPGEFLAYLSTKGLEKRRDGSPTEADYDRLNYELATIESQGLSSYFLIVWDLVRYADRQDIRRGAARGSVAGSLVAYCMDISRVDPMRHDLLFERFINPDRIALADIDLDFDSRYRDDLIRYTIEKYGDDRVAQIITFQNIRARAAVRDSTRVLGYDLLLGDRISKSLPPLVMGQSTPLDACLEYNPRYDIGYNNATEFRNMYATDPAVKEIVDVALTLEGLVRQDGIHAAAVVITPDDIRNYLPIQRKPLKGGGFGPIVTQYEKNTIEDLGLLKMDYLGLRNLDVISECIRILGYDPGVDETTFDDFETYELLRRGDTVGVFQLESKPMRALLQRMQPTTIDDIAAVVALYRPGPMASNMHYDYADRKNGRQELTLFHDDAKEILAKTYGLMIYQEQVMQVAQKFAGYTLSEADGLRKIIGKKLIDKMIAEREKFIGGCEANGYGELGAKLFDMIESFAAYAFNASHAYGYAYISYQTAFLKAHFPVEYMAALASSVASKIEKCAVFLNEARTMSIPVDTPDVNMSEVLFHSDNGENIRVGLSAIKNIGEGFSTTIIDERKKNGTFSSLIDFVERVNPSSDQVASLALAGAFDQFGTRLGISSVSKDVIALARKSSKKTMEGQTSMFDTESLWSFEIPESEFPSRMKLSKEREAIGIYVSGHPADDYAQHKTGVMLSDVIDAPQREIHEVLVEIVEVDRRITRSGQAMAHLVVSDQTGIIDVVCFPRAYGRYTLVAGDLGVMKLKVNTNIATDERSYVFEDFVSLNVGEEELDMGVMRVYLPSGFAVDDGAVSRLKGVLLSHYGNHSVTLHVSQSAVLELPDDIRVDCSDALKDDLKHLFEGFNGR